MKNPRAEHRKTNKKIIRRQRQISEGWVRCCWFLRLHSERTNFEGESLFLNYTLKYVLKHWFLLSKYVYISICLLFSSRQICISEIPRVGWRSERERAMRDNKLCFYLLKRILNEGWKQVQHFFTIDTKWKIIFLKF